VSSWFHRGVHQCGVAVSSPIARPQREPIPTIRARDVSRVVQLIGAIAASPTIEGAGTPLLMDAPIISDQVSGDG